MFDRVLNATLESVKNISAAFKGQRYQSTNLPLKVIDLYDIPKDIQFYVMELNKVDKTSFLFSMYRLPARKCKFLLRQTISRRI